MAESSYQSPSGYLTMAEARQRLGVAKATLQRMTRDGRLPAFGHPRDKRVKLVRVDDIDRLLQPVPEEPQEAKRAA